MSGSAAPVLSLGGALLFVPAQERRLAKLADLDADALIVDLEDAVHADAKAAARELAAAAISGLDSSPPVLVRINPLGEGGEEDLTALAAAPPAGLVVPKACDGAGLEAVALAARAAWGQHSAPLLIPLIESARGLLDLGGILAAGPPARLAGVALGAEDFAADMEVARSAEGTEIQLARQLIAVHARASQVVAIDTPFLDSRDDEGLRRDAQTAAALGFTAKLCIHPAQVGVVRDAFSPSPAQVEWAQGIVAAAADQEERGEAVGAIDGQMLDRPVLIQARRILERAGRPGSAATRSDAE